MNILYFDGDIITMEKEKEMVECVLVEDGKIKKTGTMASIRPFLTKETIKVDLEGKTMLPAFIDPHSHITAFASTLGFAALGGAGSFDEIGKRLEEFIEKEQLKEGEFVIGCGYDHNNLIESCYPTKEVLDKYSYGHPVIIVHASGHMAVANSKALKLLGITANSLNPKGGIIGRVKNSKEPNGYLEENAFMAVTPLIPALSEEEKIENLVKAQEIYFQYGITTIQDGLTGKTEYQLLDYAAQKEKLKADIVGYIDLNKDKHLTEKGKNYQKRYIHHLKLGGYKIFLDGSPQGKTAWLSQPYQNTQEGYCGYPIYTKEEVEKFIKIAEKEKMQLLVHCNGDAACEQLITAYENVLKGRKTSIRPVMIHAQMATKNQLERMKRIGIIPSFFVAHTYYWGDIHRKNLGEERAARISMANTAKDLGLFFTFHQDTPVILPNMLETVWCAVNRKTKSKIILGKEERITVYEALKAITIYAAYQYFEENKKGSIKEGKYADFVILSNNPIKVIPEEIKEIQVLETIKHGESVYKKE